MRSRSFHSFIIGCCCLLLAVVSGCGGRSTNPLPPPPPPQTVTFTFLNGVPTTAAVQIGTGAFTPASLQSNTLTFTLPDGTTRFSVAYVCPPIIIPGLTWSNEFVIQATLQDGPSFTASCDNRPAAGNLSGSVNASLIAGTSDVRITGNGGVSDYIGTSGLPFNVGLPSGTSDVAVIAVDSSSNALAVRMFRNQTVPGALNGGNVINLATADATTNQLITVSSLPSGFSTPLELVQYETANGTKVMLYVGPATQYRAMPPAALQAGDFYVYDTAAFDNATGNSLVGFLETSSNGGGPTHAPLPLPWSYSGPAAAAFPTFTFNYAGFSGLPSVADQATITWATGPSSFSSVTVVSSGAFQAGATTLSIPNLTSLPGFLPPAASGINVSWTASIYGGSGTSLAFALNVHPQNGSVSVVQNRGSFIEP